MEKDTILRLLKTTAMAVVNELVSRENGIGNNKKNTGSIAAINSLYDLRKGIINENISLVLKDKNFNLSERSFLLGITETGIENANLEPIIKPLADILESELIKVRDVIIPEVNELATEFNDLAHPYLKNKTNNDIVTVSYYSNSNILSLLSGSDLVGMEGSDGSDFTDISYSFGVISDFDVIKKSIRVGNPIVDEAINKFISVLPDEYWLNLYNDIFTNVSIDNKRLTVMSVNKLSNVNDNIFCYLVSRAISNGSLELTVEGNANDYKNAVSMLVYHFKQVLARTVATAKNTSDSLWIKEPLDNVLVVRKENMGELDIDTIIGSYILGVYKTEDVIANQEACKQQCITAIDLLNIENNKTKINKLREIYMSVAMKYLISQSEENDDKSLVKATINGEVVSIDYNTLRLAVSEIVYDADDSVVMDPKKMFKDIVIGIKETRGNSGFILNRMSFYIATLDKTDDMYKDVSEYVALELVSKYLVNTHIVIEDV